MKTTITRIESILNTPYTVVHYGDDNIGTGYVDNFATLEEAEKNSVGEVSYYLQDNSMPVERVTILAKKEYIEVVRNRIEDASNHGNQGSSWWYPTPWTVAYNVKMKSYHDNGELRKKMSKLQHEYYSNDEALHELWYQQLDMAWQNLREQLSEIDSVEEVRQAGRSGGWCEVTYSSIDDVDEDMTAEEVEDVYLQALKLSTDEEKAHATIEHAHRALNRYIDTDEYYKDCVEQLMTDDDIREHYLAQCEKLLAKLQNIT